MKLEDIEIEDLNDYNPTEQEIQAARDFFEDTHQKKEESCKYCSTSDICSSLDVDFGILGKHQVDLYIDSLNSCLGLDLSERNNINTAWCTSVNIQYCPFCGKKLSQ